MSVVDVCLAVALGAWDRLSLPDAVPTQIQQTQTQTQTRPSVAAPPRVGERHVIAMMHVFAAVGQSYRALSLFEVSVSVSVHFKFSNPSM